VSSGVRALSVALGGALVLRDVDLDAPAGSVTAIVGGDGAGKSTLLRCLVGELTPSAGEVRRPDRALIGYMPATSGSWKQLTVDENLAFVGRAFGMSAEYVRQRRAALVRRAGLSAATDRLAGDLSGGMRQKLGFVMAMLHEPELLVLDEPSTGVDPVSRVELWRLISEAAVGGAAVVMTTSYLDEAERAGSISVLDDGRMVAAGTRDEIIESFPGSITAPDRAGVPERSWRRAGAVREWHPDRTTVGSTLGHDEIEFEDAVIAHLLAARTTSPRTVAT
jgi:ABC-2 type transport system ATP-binding protein